MCLPAAVYDAQLQILSELDAEGDGYLGGRRWPGAHRVVHLLDQRAERLERTAQHICGNGGDGLSTPSHGNEWADAAHGVVFLLSRSTFL
ncbi:hypothetical protein ACM01_16025 [Streptomyces viridochromogenes]|uniref:Uncharacterized protein n=1 Tax=Streptomyces viridochromogenes TaxID=1938 RepID=A0A0J7ZG18_STRVR|nr:hypothetical protein ACM01_16025 [Streptomyces viridochromogenes]